MTYDLFPHQKKGALFLASKPGTRGLYFGMGTGKTVTALEACYLVESSLHRNVLIIAPPIALPMWQREAKAYLNSTPQILKTGTTKITDNVNILVVSYTIATKRFEELRDWIDGGILICDESHALKSTKAKRTQNILGRDGIATGAEYTWLLTGTPITRWNDDMFPFLCRADLSGIRKTCGGVSLERFQMRFCVRQQRQFPGSRWPTWMTVGNQNTEELASWIYGEGHAIRVDLEEVFNMPPLTHNRYDVDLDADAVLKADLKALEGMTLAEIEEKKNSNDEHLASIRRRLGLAKVKAAANEIAERVESGQNVLVGAWHTDVIDELEKAMFDKGYSTGIIDGRASAGIKDDLTKRWNNGDIQVLICQIAAAGVSLNLQHGGTQIIVVEEDWSPSIMDQFYARLWRYGQEKHVHVDTLTANTKLDKAVARISANKAAQHEKFNAVGRRENA